MTIRHDLHVHSTYSDGWDMAEMAKTAVDMGLEGLGFADHCPIGPDDFGRRDRYDLTETYEDRRSDLTTVSDRYGIRVFDAAEVNYTPEREKRIERFLSKAGFAYTIGSIHFTDRFDIVQPRLNPEAESERHQAVERYVDWQVALIESELFDVAGHIDLVQRDPVLRGLMTEVDYERIADALANSRTIPEINGGRLDRSYGTIHPHPDMLSIFAERNIPFVLGTDSHAPDQLERRLTALESVIEEVPVEIVPTPPAIA